MINYIKTQFKALISLLAWRLGIIKPSVSMAVQHTMGERLKYINFEFAQGTDVIAYCTQHKMRFSQRLLDDGQTLQILITLPKVYK